MRTTLALTAALLLALPLSVDAQDARATLAEAARALGTDGLKSLEYSGSRTPFAFGQSAAPGQPWPRLTFKSFTRSVNYETASLHDAIIRTQGDNPVRGGGQQPIRGEQRQSFWVSGDHAWSVVGSAAVPASIALVERRVIAFAMPGCMRLRATLDDQNFADTLKRLNPAVDRLLPLHGRLVPIADLHSAVSHAH
jgi:hypothetical protein